MGRPMAIATLGRPGLIISREITSSWVDIDLQIEQSVWLFDIFPKVLDLQG